MPSPSAIARLRDNLARVRDRIDAACGRSRRDPAEVTLVAVTKSAGDAEVEALIDLGVRDLGESRGVEGSARAKRFGGDVRWHFIGHLQTNKSAKVIEAFQVLHSVDRESLALDLYAKCSARNMRLPVFVQVNVSGEPTKGGFRPEEAARQTGLLKLDGFPVMGLMTMARAGPPETARTCFRRLRELAMTCMGKGFLSMGMSDDFEIAIEEGATHIRVGTALFA